MSPQGRCPQTLGKPHALRFQPILKRTIWGGRRLGEQLGKPIGPESDYAESWEVVDRGDDQSVVCGGPLDGTTLSELVREEPEWLLGKNANPDRFPLLLKYLDCNQILSVQVHPDDAYARQMSPPDLGKTEAWYVVASEPESRIYAGLQEGVDRATLAEAIQAGRTEETLHSFHPEAGDCLFIPAGTVHALGAGLLVCEIQQSSDTTFRLFDWNRLDAEGKSRPLHIEAALQVTDYELGPVSARRMDRTRRGWQPLVECDKFVLRAATHGDGSIGGDALISRDRLTDREGLIGGDGRFHLLTVPEGRAEVTWANETLTLQRGETVLIPAGADAGSLSIGAGGVLLAMQLP